MTTVTIIYLLFLAVGLFLILYFKRRIDKVYDFRTEVLDVCMEYAKDHLPEPYSEEDPFVFFYAKLPDWEKMIYSFKPIKYETYYTDEEIDRINS